MRARARGPVRAADNEDSRADERAGADPSDALVGADADGDDDRSAPWDEAARAAVVPREHDGKRLDQTLASLWPEFSRARLQRWIDGGAVARNGVAPRAKDRVQAGDRIEFTPPPSERRLSFAPEVAVLASLEIVHEDESILVINKPPGLVVHPGAGNWSGTLQNGLLALDPRQAHLPRAGIVHRLDALTSGLMVVARTPQALTELARQLQAREIQREYWAIVYGRVPAAGVIEERLERDPRNPLRFRISRAAAARHARTLYRCLQTVATVPPLSWVALRLDTGRTHQIRVHMEYLGHPLVGDPIYHRGRPIVMTTADASRQQKQGSAERRKGEQETADLATFPRQALHACRLELTHPRSALRLSWFRAPPADMLALMRAAGLPAPRRWRTAF